MTACMQHQGTATDGAGVAHRRARYRLSAAGLALAIAACAAPIRTGYETAAFPSAMTTYAWGGSEGCERAAPLATDQRISPFTMDRIHTAIDTNLRAKGYQRVDCAADADFVVTFSVWLDDKVRVNSYPDPWLGVYRRRDLYYRVEATQYTTGTLTVDMFDADGGKPLWHGWASKTVTPSDRNAPEAAIRDGVNKLLEPFPVHSG